MSWQNTMQQLETANTQAATSEARRKLTAFFDGGSFTEIDRLAGEGVVAGYGLVDGAPVYAYMQDKAVCAGAIGLAQAAKIVKMYELAAQNGAPIVAFLDSDGVRLAEGVGAMDAVAQILLHANTLSGVVPQIAVVLGACVGSAALIAANADITVAVSGADFRCCDDAVKAAVTCADEAAAMDTVVRLLAMLPGNNLSVPVVYECDGVGQAVCDKAEDAIVTFADADTVMPLYAKDDGRYNVAFARIGGVACGCIVLAGDEVCDCRARRAARFMRLCDAFSLPVITFVDAAAFASLDGAAKVSHAYAEATCAKITVITGRAYGPVYIAAAGKSAGADAVLAWPLAVISPLAPETAIHILWSDRLQHMADPAKEREALAAEYAATEGSPVKAAAEGYVTDVIAPAETAGRLSALLEMLAGKRVSRLPKKHSNIQL